MFFVYSLGGNPALIYRFVAHMQPIIGLMELGVFIPVLGIFSMVGIQAYLYVALRVPHSARPNGP